jgi:hypothetical protein
MHDELCHSHECSQTGHERAHAGDNDDGVAEPLPSASFDGGHVHVWKGACSHGGDGVLRRGRGAGGKNKPCGDVQRGVSTAAEAGHGVRRSQAPGVVLWSCLRVPSSLSSPRLWRPAPPDMGP